MFSRIATALRNKHDGIWVSGEHEDVPAQFPAVTIVETDNSVYAKMRTTVIENAAKLLYEVNVYTNTIGYKKSEAQEIMNDIDAEFVALGFTRTMLSPTPNLQDATIYRLLGRYEGVAQPEGDDTVRIYTR